MTLSRALLHIDHHKAEVVRLDAERVQTQQIRAHEHVTRQHGSEGGMAREPLSRRP